MTSQQQFPDDIEQGEIERIIAEVDQLAATNSLLSGRRYVKHGEYALVEVPKKLVPRIRRLIAEYEAAKGSVA